MGMCQSRRASLRDDEAIESDIMEFLIVLKSNDYEAECPLSPSYSTRVRKSENDLPGILHIVNIVNINDKAPSETRPKFVTQDIVIPRALYIKLPKENIYVKAEKWEYEYLKSQIQEIIHIFGILGAKTIKYEIINSDKHGLDAGGGLNVGELPVGVDLQVTKRKGTTTELSGELEYPVPRNKIPTKELLIMSNDIYYLPRKYDWKSICQRRIEKRVTSDDFIYKFYSDMFFSTKLSGKLEKLGINFNFETNSVKNFNMKFEVDYYEVEDIDIDIDVYDHKSINSNNYSDNESDISVHDDVINDDQVKAIIENAEKD